MATATFMATAGVVAGIATGVEHLTEEGSPATASFATDVARTATELESWRRAVLEGEETKRELEAAARKKAEEQARRKAEEEARKKAEAEARKKAEEEARKKAEEQARKKAEAEARKKAEEEARKKAEQEARKKAEQEARKDTKTQPSQSKEQSASGSPKDIARDLVAAEGWSSGQFDCLEKLWTRESSWRVDAENPSSGAYGIPQALPASKMATFGDDWRTNPVTQIKWGLDYIKGRYGTPCGAWSAFQSKGWY